MPSIGRTAVLAWRDMGRAFVAMPALALFIVGLMAIFPLLVLSGLLLYPAGWRRPGGIAGKLVAIVASGALSTLMVTLLVVIASRFYEWIGERVKRPNGADGRQ